MNMHTADRRTRTENLQRRLNMLASAWGCPEMKVPVTGQYNERTENAVRAFQERECIPVTGISDRETWDDLCRCCREEEELCAPVTLRILPPDCGFCLSPGEEDDMVFLLQYILRGLNAEYGLGPVPLDGIYGSATEAAVRRFQALCGLPVTGRAERATWRRLAEAFEP